MNGSTEKLLAAASPRLSSQKNQTAFAQGTKPGPPGYMLFGRRNEMGKRVASSAFGRRFKTTPMNSGNRREVCLVIPR